MNSKQRKKLRRKLRRERKEIPEWLQPQREAENKSSKTACPSSNIPLMVPTATQELQNQQIRLGHQELGDESLTKPESDKTSIEQEKLLGLPKRILVKLWRNAPRLNTILRILFALATLGIALFEAWPYVKPHVSVEPGPLLDSHNAFSTQFQITNQNSIFGVRHVVTTCGFFDVETSHNVGLTTLGLPLPSLQHTITSITPKGTSSIDCPDIRTALMGPFGPQSVGEVESADVQIHVSYRQNWFPFPQNEYYPFHGAKDDRGIVQWIHKSPSEWVEKPPLPIPASGSK